MTGNHPDRRRDPRLTAQIPLRVNHQAGAIEARTENISTSGAYCTLGRFLPLMTKLKIRLELSASRKRSVLNCQGVVVRVQPGGPSMKTTRYGIAIFFNELSDYKRALLGRYIRQRLPAGASAND
ncbi:MAG: PilZ domain-containing protein [Candidatus Omnitrophica bacterium]|nr:PilZ domain-containing protein [Candidatus Omnitrophota bacterium]